MVLDLWGHPREIGVTHQPHTLWEITRFALNQSWYICTWVPYFLLLDHTVVSLVIRLAFLLISFQLSFTVSVFPCLAVLCSLPALLQVNFVGWSLAHALPCDSLVDTAIWFWILTPTPQIRSRRNRFGKRLLEQERGEVMRLKLLAHAWKLVNYWFIQGFLSTTEESSLPWFLCSVLLLLLWSFSPLNSPKSLRFLHNSWFSPGVTARPLVVLGGDSPGTAAVAFIFGFRQVFVSWELPIFKQHDLVVCTVFL